MSKNTRKNLAFIRYSDLSALCERLEKMEAEGWRLESLHLLAEYRRCEPRKVRYSAELLDTAHIIGNAIPPKSREYIDLCEQAGWSLVSHYGPLHIFRTEDIDAPEIVSDPVEKLHAIKRASLRMYLTMWLLILLPLLNLMVFSRLSSPAVLATQYYILFIAISGIFGIAIATIYTVDFVIWYSKASRAVRAGLPIPYNDMKAVHRATVRDRILIIAVLATPLLLSLPGAVNGEFAQLRSSLLIAAWGFVFLVSKYFYSKKDRSTAKALLVATAISFSLVFLLTVGSIVLAVVGFVDHRPPSVKITTDYRGKFLPNSDSIPVTLLDFDPAAGECTNQTDGESSILAGLYKYESETVHTDEGWKTLSYEIYHNRCEWLLQSYAREFGADDPDYEYVWTEIEATPWGANEAFIANDDRWRESAFIIIYDEYVLVIDTIDTDSDDAVVDKYEEVFSRLLGN